AGGLLQLRVDDPVHFVAARTGMAVGAVEAERGGDDAHAADEVVDAQLLERAGRDVLERLARLLVPSGRRDLARAAAPGLSGRPDGPHESGQPHAYESSDCESPPDVHLVPLHMIAENPAPGQARPCRVPPIRIHRIHSRSWTAERGRHAGSARWPG